MQVLRSLSKINTPNLVNFHKLLPMQTFLHQDKDLVNKRLPKLLGDNTLNIKDYYKCQNRYLSKMTDEADYKENCIFCKIAQKTQGMNFKAFKNNLLNKIGAPAYVQFQSEY